MRSVAPARFGGGEGQCGWWQLRGAAAPLSDKLQPLAVCPVIRLGPLHCIHGQP